MAEELKELVHLGESDNVADTQEDIQDDDELIISPQELIISPQEPLNY